MSEGRPSGETARFGTREHDFRAFAGLLASSVNGRNVANEVARFRQSFIDMRNCLEDGDLDQHTRKLQATF